MGRQQEESRDRSVKQSKADFLELVKNTYRVLLSRGMKGCYVCFLDKNTERFIRSRMDCSRPHGRGTNYPIQGFLRSGWQRLLNSISNERSATMTVLREER